MTRERQLASHLASGAFPCTLSILRWVRCTLRRPSPPRERRGGTAPRHSRGALSFYSYQLAVLTESSRHFLEHAPLLARETVEPLGGDLVEHAIHVLGLEIAGHNFPRRRDRCRTLR